jgi:hypothetical protein
MPGGETESDESEWARRIAREQQAWQASSPSLKSAFYFSLPCNIRRRKQLAEAARSGLQAEIDGWIPSPCDCGHATFSQEADGDVTYFGLNNVFKLQLFKRRCMRCHKDATPSPVSFGCFPNTPTTPHIWLEISLLQMYGKFGCEGLSSTGGHLFCSLPCSFSLCYMLS